MILIAAGGAHKERYNNSILLQNSENYESICCRSRSFSSQCTKIMSAIWIAVVMTPAARNGLAIVDHPPPMHMNRKMGVKESQGLFMETL